MREEPLPHEKAPGSNEEWQFDTVNNPKAVSRAKAAEFYNGANGGADDDAVGGAGFYAIFVMPFIVGIMLVGLAFLPFFWIGVFAAGAGWTLSATSKLVALPVLLIGTLLLTRKLGQRPAGSAGRSQRRPFEHTTSLGNFWRSLNRLFRKGRPASLGDALLLAFTCAFGWLVFSGRASDLNRVGPDKNPAWPAVANLGLDVVNLPLLAVQTVPKVAKGVGGIETISIPLFLIAANALFYAIPLSFVLWPTLRAIQFMKK